MPNSPLILPRKTNERTMPLQNDRLRIKGFWLCLNPARYANVIGRRESEHGPRLVNKPPVKTRPRVNGPGWLSPLLSKCSLVWARSAIKNLREDMAWAGGIGLT